MFWRDQVCVMCAFYFVLYAVCSHAHSRAGTCASRPHCALCGPRQGGFSLCMHLGLTVSPIQVRRTDLLAFQRLRAGQWIGSVTDWAIRITDWALFPDWVSSRARLADPIWPMPNKGKSGHSGLPIALISRLPNRVVQSVLPIAIHQLLQRRYPLASMNVLLTG